jgi:hypothetical protein
MKLVTLAMFATLAATPVMAAAGDYPSDASSTAVTAPQDNPNVDVQTAQADAAKQSYYKHKLEAAKAQSQVDSAAANRDAAQDQAAQDRADHAAAVNQ